MTEFIRAVSSTALAVSCSVSAVFSPPTTIKNTAAPIEVHVQAPMEFTLMSEFDEPVVAEEVREPIFPYTEEEVYLLALITMAEAEGEPEYGQRLVADTILNRIDNGTFAHTIKGVIYEDGQFESTWNGRIEQVTVTERMMQICREEMMSRANYDVIFFRTGRYSDYGTPLFKVGHHFFSGA